MSLISLHVVINYTADFISVFFIYDTLLCILLTDVLFLGFYFFIIGIIHAHFDNNFFTLFNMCYFHIKWKLFITRNPYLKRIKWEFKKKKNGKKSGYFYFA